MAGCFTLFATHFGRLSELASMYPNARVWHLGVSTGADGERLHYTRQLQPGAADNQHYGLLLASAVGIPAEVWPPPPGDDATAIGRRCCSHASALVLS